MISPYFRKYKLEEPHLVLFIASWTTCYHQLYSVCYNSHSMQSHKTWNLSNATFNWRIKHINKAQKIHCIEGHVRVNAPAIFIIGHHFYILNTTLLEFPKYVCNLFINSCNSYFHFRFIMNLKLFTVMGISWVLEIISTFNTNETITAILDTYNIFIGVFIFIIFVFKRKVLYELKCRFGKNV